MWAENEVDMKVITIEIDPLYDDVISMTFVGGIGSDAINVFTSALHLTGDCTNMKLVSENGRAVLHHCEHNREDKCDL